MMENNKIKSFFIIFFCNLFILTAGYPYFIIYSLFLFIPYIIFIPFLVNNFYYLKLNYFYIRFYLLIFLSFFISYLVALPWLLKVKSLVSNLVDRSEKNLGFTGESHSFYWKDTIGSWIFPSASNTEGWYYSSIILTFIIFFGFFTILSNQKKINFFEKKLFIFSVIMILFITYYTWGKNSVLFLWSWENIPLLGSLRAWPRLNILIVPFIILLFSLSLKNLKAYFEENNKKNLDKIIKLFFLIFICCLSLQFIFYFFDYQNQYYWDFWQKKRFDAAIDYLPNILGNILKLYDGEIYILFNIFCIIFLITILSKNRLRKNITQFYTAILFLSSLELFVLSNLQWSLPEWKTKIYKIDNPLKELQNGFNSKRIIDTVKGNEYFRDNRSFNVNYPDSYGYKKHAENFDTYFQRTNGIKNINISNNDIELVKLFYGASNEAKNFSFRIFKS